MWPRGGGVIIDAYCGDALFTEEAEQRGMAVLPLDRRLGRGGVNLGATEVGLEVERGIE